MATSLRRRLAAFNRVVTNPIQGVYAWLLPPWAVILHRGRRSGRLYRTPVLAVRRGEHIAVRVLYGVESDWVRNLLAAGPRGRSPHALQGADRVARASAALSCGSK